MIPTNWICSDMLSGIVFGYVWLRRGPENLQAHHNVRVRWCELAAASNRARREEEEEEEKTKSKLSNWHKYTLIHNNLKNIIEYLETLTWCETNT